MFWKYFSWIPSLLLLTLWLLLLWKYNEAFQFSGMMGRKFVNFEWSTIVSYVTEGKWILIIKNGSKIGNFVEIKKSNIGKNSKVNHLSYIGDTLIGSKVNIGAGTITCNYDGKNKYKTKIKNNVFVGSNTSLVAPVTLNEKSNIGASSVITKSVPKNTLALTRAKQIEIKNYKRK